MTWLCNFQSHGFLIQSKIALQEEEEDGRVRVRHKTLCWWGELCVGSCHSQTAMINIWQVAGIHKLPIKLFSPPPPKTLIKSMKDRVNPGLVTLQLTFIDKGRRLTARGQAGNVKKKKNRPDEGCTHAAQNENEKRSWVDSVAVVVELEQELGCLRCMSTHKFRGGRAVNAQAVMTHPGRRIHSQLKAHKQAPNSQACYEAHNNPPPTYLHLIKL